VSPSVFGRLLVHIPAVLTSVHRPAAVANFLSLLISCPKVLSPWNSCPDKGPQSLDWRSCIRSLVHIPAVLMSSVHHFIQFWVLEPPVLKFSLLGPAVLTSVHRPSALTEVLSPSSIHRQYHTSSCDHFLPPSFQFTVPGLSHQLALRWI